MVEKVEVSNTPKVEQKELVFTKFTYTFDTTDPLIGKYGILDYIVSKTNPDNRYNTQWNNLHEINESNVDQIIRVRVRLQRVRAGGKNAFLVMRQALSTLQGCLFVTENEVSVQMVQFIGSIPHESIIDVTGRLVKVNKPVESCTISNYELQIHTVFLVQPCVNVLPFQFEDGSRRVEKGEEDKEVEVLKESEQLKEEVPIKEVVPENKTEEKVVEGKEEKKDKKKDKENKKKEKEKENEEKKKEKEAKQNQNKIIVKSNTRFDNRVLDLRIPSTQALMRLQSGVGKLFREYLDKLNFVEIHTPKLIQGASEGGTNVFAIKYFGKDGCLAQSPQLYKQMAIIGGLERVYEIAPVFRAENSNTGRHLCEFTMLDVEMTFKEHYFELHDVINELFVHIFDGLKNNYKHELNIVANQYPFELIEYKKDLVRLTFHEGVALLKEKGIEQDVNEDLDTINEKKLGEIVKEKYGTDFYLLCRYPKKARPFYTMRDPFDDNFTNSYDAFIRGEEILSGAQRIHDYEKLLKNVIEAGINPESLKDYLNAFKLGAPPHGGLGIGLERIVKLFTSFGNVKRCCMFPRDPQRLAP